MPLSKYKVPAWATALFTITASVAGATWTARGIVADVDKRITIIEQVVPMELHEIHDDVRELRRSLLSK